MVMQRNIHDIKENLVNARNNGKKCTLLIGAGCSVKANIPLASEFVKLIEKEYPSAYKRAEEKTYPKVMSQLHLGQRRDLIARYIDDAKINWAHICIAMLIQKGYVDRVLTTNFDPLIVRACALLNEFPAVYDFAASQLFKPADVADKAVFHLHGQRGGFVLLNTEEECKKHSEHLGPVFSDSTQGRMWIVVGYSGDNDPVFDHLANIKRFDYGLYWIGYEKEPSEHVRERLLVEGKDAYFVKDYDADSFFRDLTRELDIFPPDFISKPFTHMSNCFEMIAPFSSSGDESGHDVMSTTHKQIKECIENYEKPESQVRNANELLMQGDYDKVVEMHPLYNENPSPEFADVISWGYMGQGDALYEDARIKEGEEAEKLFYLAIEKCEAALNIKPDIHEAFYNWGLTLSGLAKIKEGEEAEKLFYLAIEKYEATLNLKSDYYDALFNWGFNLICIAKMKEGEEAENLFNLAFEKYEAELKIKPDDHVALYNWGTAISDLAKMKEGKEAEKLFNLAFEKYEAALNIKPDKHEALYNWGTALSDLAKMKEGEKVENLFNLAFEKYESALKIKPNYHEALDNWGSALYDLAKMKEGEEAQQLLSESRTKLLLAEQIKTGSGAYNLACISALLNDDESCRKWLELSYESESIPDVEHLNSDSDLDNVRETSWFREIIANMMVQK